MPWTIYIAKKDVVRGHIDWFVVRDSGKSPSGSGGSSGYINTFKVPSSKASLLLFLWSFIIVRYTRSNQNGKLALCCCDISSSLTAILLYDR